LTPRDPEFHLAQRFVSMSPNAPPTNPQGGDALEAFNASTQQWFRETFGLPTEVQNEGWRRIAEGQHALLLAPTGSGKTLAAFLWAIDRTLHGGGHAPAARHKSPGYAVLYISPLKALAYDVDRNLRAPLVGIQRVADLLGTPVPAVQVDVRTGDTPARQRKRQSQEPGHILVTTPESLFLMLGSSMAQHFKSIHTVIIDEVHALAPSKRGTHLVLSLERLSKQADGEPQRIGLSATVRPPESVAAFLGGHRPVSIVDTTTPPKIDLTIRVPPEEEPADSVSILQKDTWLDTGGSVLSELYHAEKKPPKPEGRSNWARIHPELVAHIRAHRSTIVFVNSRGMAERLAQNLNELAQEPLVEAHHGSVSPEQRKRMEERLKAGTLPGVVATSSLELGVDMGAVDQVIMVESPGSVARGLQRLGRAGHQVGAVSRGQIFPKMQSDLLESAVVAKGMREGQIEAVKVPENCLDVLAQQLVAMVCSGTESVEDLWSLVTRAHPYRNLTKPLFLGVLDMLCGKYPSADFADLKPVLDWDRSQGVLTPRRGTVLLSRLNAGTIPDRGLYAVRIAPDGPRVGELDEEMVFESKPGDTIILGASSWRIEDITQDKVLVSPAPGEPGRLPFWRGDGPGRPIELGRALGRELRTLGKMGANRSNSYLQETCGLDEPASARLVDYLRAQKEATGRLPDDRTLVFERFRDELGDWRICILSCFGARIHAPWAMALQHMLSQRAEVDVQVMYTDDGIALRFADTEHLPTADALLPPVEDLEEWITAQVENSALFAATFRENAGRALLLPKRRGGKRTPLWARRLRSKSLLATVRKYPAFPIVLETYRECLQDVFDLPSFEALLKDIAESKIAIVEVETERPSPFARNLVHAYVARFLYDQDVPAAERRAQALTLDRHLLRELLGTTQLRDVLDPRAVEEVEEELQHLAQHLKASNPEQLRDLVRRLGDLSSDEIAARREATGGTQWLGDLHQIGALVKVGPPGTARWIAAEDAGLYRDALGWAPPIGVLSAFLDPTEEPLSVLVRRFARTHGPFSTRTLAARYGLSPAVVEAVLKPMEKLGTLVRGEIRPGGSETDWCDAEVLRRIRRRSIARLRHQAAPVADRALGLFLPHWHGIPTHSKGSANPQGATLGEALLPLEGLALPWSVLLRDLLPSRQSGFRPEYLDALISSGNWIWVGDGALGDKDGRIRLFRRDRLPFFLLSPEVIPFGSDDDAVAVLDAIRSEGASFFSTLVQATLLPGDDASMHAERVESALWRAVWMGLVTNDTLAPLFARARPSGRWGRRGRGPSAAAGRWSLVHSRAIAPVPDTERLLATAEGLLDRYGIVSREAVLAEGQRFGTLYPVYQSMEDSGNVRRGYFIEGLSGVQFALPGVVDRLRALATEPALGEERKLRVQCLAALDPANPYGAILPWPASTVENKGRCRREPGAYVVLFEGRLALYLSRTGKRLACFLNPAQESQALHRALEALRTARRPNGGRLFLQEANGTSAMPPDLAAALSQSGFQYDDNGWTPNHA
jgi:ATP-dependent helicase Lhr and Lhr-like helicase